MCVPPDFREWIDGLGIEVTPIGPELRKLTAASAPTSATAQATPPAPPSPERRRQLAEASVATQFETVASAAQGCDVIVAATALQIAARSVAEKMGIPYVFVAYCPIVLPSPHHAPPNKSLNRAASRLHSSRLSAVAGAGVCPGILGKGGGA